MAVAVGWPSGQTSECSGEREMKTVPIRMENSTIRAGHTRRRYITTYNERMPLKIRMFKILTVEII